MRTEVNGGQRFFSLRMIQRAVIYNFGKNPFTLRKVLELKRQKHLTYCDNMRYRETPMLRIRDTTRVQGSSQFLWSTASNKEHL